MAFPFIFESNFEAGGIAEWAGGETDTETQLDVAHYSELARYPWPTCQPYSGAYALRAVLSGGTADAFIKSTTIAAAADLHTYIAFRVWFSPSFTGTANDTFVLLELQETGNAPMITIGARVVAATNVINIGAGKATPTSFAARAIQRGVWYTIEADINIDAGGGNDGDVNIYITAEDEAYSSTAEITVATLDQTAVTHGVLGIQDHLATTTGVILYNDFTQDDARLYPARERFPLNVLSTKTEHIFVGPGKIKQPAVLSGSSTDSVLTIFDTDAAETADASNIVAEVKGVVAATFVQDSRDCIEVKRGCYVQLAGTAPRSLVTIERAQVYGSIGAQKDRGLRRL